MKILPLSQAPQAVIDAFNHVSTHIQNLASVEYDVMCEWCYTTEGGLAPTFKGIGIDVGILDQGADAQYNIGVPIKYTK